MKGINKMKCDFDLTKSEYEVMKILWDSNVPMLKQDILKISDQYKWNDNYLKKMLTVLYKKGALTSVGAARVGKVNSRLYVPTVSEDEYNLSKYPVRSINIIASLVDELYKNADDDGKKKVIRKLEDMLDEFKK